MASISRLAPATLLLAAPAAAQVTVDGSTAGDAYGAALSVQTVQTEFGDNFSELNAAYGTIQGGRLYITLTGNIENNFNKLEVLIDSVAGGENVFSGVPGNDGTGVMTGLTFDAGFEADYHLILRRGFAGTPRFDVDFAVLGTPNFDFYADVFGGTDEGAGSTGTGVANASPIEIAYDNSNVAGITGGNGAADQSAALAVTTGAEFSIALSDLGNPVGPIKVMAFVNGSNHNYSSNQYLGGLAAPQGNLGGDGTGVFTGFTVFDLGSFVGEQFFTVPSGAGAPGTPVCFGTGCPCGNDNAAAGCANTTGSGALLDASGVASIANDTLVLTATNAIPAQPGLFFQGNTTLNGGAGFIFGNGLRCCGNDVIRLVTVTPNSLGCAASDGSCGTVVGGTAGSISANPAQLGNGAVDAGETKCYQFWYRDPVGGGACGSGGFSLTNAYEITWGA